MARELEALAGESAEREPTKAEIRWRAYEIYLSRNGGPGDATADWRRAERELRARKAAAAQTELARA